MGLIWADDDLSDRAEDRGPRHWAPYRRWSQEEVRDFETAHICRRCGEKIPAGRLHLRRWTTGPGPGAAATREHLAGHCRREIAAEMKGSAAAVALLWIAAASLTVIAALAVVWALR